MITRNNIEWGREGQLGHLYRHRVRIEGAPEAIMDSSLPFNTYLDIYSKREEPVTNFKDLLYILPLGKEHGCYGKVYTTPIKDIVGVKLNSSTEMSYYYFDSPGSIYTEEATLENDPMISPIFVKDEVTMIF